MRSKRLSRTQRADVLLDVADCWDRGQVCTWAYQRYAFVSSIFDNAMLEWLSTCDPVSVYDIAISIALTEVCALGFDLQGASKVATLVGRTWRQMPGKP